MKIKRNFRMCEAISIFRKNYVSLWKIADFKNKKLDDMRGI